MGFCDCVRLNLYRSIHFQPRTKESQIDLLFGNNLVISQIQVITMIFTCPQCQSRTATPSMFDRELKEVDCGNCGKVLSVAEHGDSVAPLQKKSIWTNLLERFINKNAT